MGRLFGTNGVRGVVNRDLKADMVLMLAASAGSLLGNRIALGRDGRTSSPMFRNAVVSGLVSVGCQVHDAGMLPTPALQYAVKHFGLDGGLMVTASHNPPEFNGVKVVAGDGVEIPRQRETEIEEVFFRGGPRLVQWNQIGTVSELSALKVYINAILSKVNREAITAAGMAVAIDPGNGVASPVAQTIARELGCSVFSINADIDGRFPGRDSEPRPDNLSGLRGLVEASDADLGVAFDGDGDRSIFIDEKGDVHWGDRSFALVAREFLSKNPGEMVATPVSSSRVLGDVVSEGGGRLVWTPVGSVDVSRTMVEKGIRLGGEENGGIMYGPHQPVRDGAMAMALILEIMAKNGLTLSELLSELPQYVQMKDKIACPDDLKRRVLDGLQGLVEAHRVETVDGLKLWYSDGSWILIRPSGTEPVFRLYAEAVKRERVIELIDRHKLIVDELLDSLGPGS